MADNTKVQRIPLLGISVAQKFSSDLYYDDFFLHPKDIPIAEQDLEVFRLWNVKELELRDDAQGQQSQDSTAAALSEHFHVVQPDSDDLRQAKALHQEICNFIFSSYQIVNKQLHFPAGEPLDTIKRFIEDIRRLGFSILRFQEFQIVGTYAEIHATNSFILTVALANAAKMPPYRLINLALSAMFHEVGVKKFAHLLEQDKLLSKQEFQQQKAHVRETMNLLKRYHFPSETMEGILHHHERLDGSGYPGGMVGNGISSFGRYLGLVCSYVAMISDQKFRQSRLAHTAILTLLKEAKVRYDASLVRLLVQLLSLYPIGSYVMLSNRAIGRVVRSKQQDPRMPIVQVLLGSDHKPIAKTTVLETNQRISIAQPVPYKKIASLIARPPEEPS